VFGLLNEDDYVSIVTFDRNVETVLSATQWGSLDRSHAEDVVENIETGGSTDIYGGLDAAADSVADLSAAGTAAKRVLLFSDGKQNAPSKSTDEFRELAEEIDERGVRIFAGGIGQSYEEETIRTLGETARGRWVHVTTPDRIERFFGDAVEEAQTVVGPDAELRLKTKTGIELADVHRAADQAQEADVVWRGNTARIKLPDLRRGTAQRVTFELDAPEFDVGQTVTLADVSLHSADRVWATETLDVTYTDDPAKLSTHVENVDISHYQTRIRSKLGRDEVDEAETLIDEAETVIGEREVADLRDAHTRIKENDEDRGIRWKETTLSSDHR
jgi:Ca-activated chloride channel family protein